MRRSLPTEQKQKAPTMAGPVAGSLLGGGGGIALGEIRGRRSGGEHDEPRADYIYANMPFQPILLRNCH